MKFTAEQFQKYYESRLEGQRMSRMGDRTQVRCPFHDDNVASMAINMDIGTWYCHAEKRGGGMVDFEKLWSNCDQETAWERVLEVIGAERRLDYGKPPEAKYIYRDEFGKVLYEKLRYPNAENGKKRMVWRTYDETRGRWEYKRHARLVLYNLPEVISARFVCICEGEKDADNVNDLHGGMVATSVPDGAGKWDPEWSKYFGGKQVVIFEDNDEIGRRHAQRVALELEPFAVGIKIVSFPDLSEHGDVSDYLKDHTADQLAKLVNSTPKWKPVQDGSLIVNCEDFIANAPEHINWLVDGVIQVGDNGIIAADPKGSKSFVMVKLALCLATGRPWLEFQIPRKAKTVLVSREDNPAITQRRIKRLLRGMGLTAKDVKDYFFLNSRAQSKELMLDNEAQMTELMSDLRRIKPELLILDVFNVLHAGDENDNKAMRDVLSKVTRIQSEIGCSVALVHHFRKGGEGTLTQKLRGSSAIAGWVEWCMGIELVDEEKSIRRMSFELKVDEAAKPFYYKIFGDKESPTADISRVDYEPPEETKKGGGRW